MDSKPESHYTVKMMFSPGAMVRSRPPLLPEKMDFCCIIRNLVSNYSHIYRKMNRGLHHIPKFEIFAAGTKY